VNTKRAIPAGVDESIRRGAVNVAVEQVIGSSAHRKSSLRTLKRSTLIALAYATVLEGKSAANARNDLGIKVPERNVARWCRNVYKRYESIYEAKLAGSAESADIRAARGDLPVQANLAWGMLLERLAGPLAALDWDDLNTNARHVVLRALEGATKAAEVQSKIQLSDVKADRLAVQLRAIIGDAEKPGGKKTKAEVLAEVKAAVDRVMLGGAE